MFSILWICFLLTEKTSAQADRFEYGSHTFEGKTIPYRLFKPDNMDLQKQYPVILTLHGIHDRGNDNESPLHSNRMALSWADSANQAKWPCFILVPQCPAGERWYVPSEETGEFDIENTIIDIIDSLIVEFPVDTNRLYVTGLSLGGYGTWHLIERFPVKFAAAVPICGGGNERKVSQYIHLPIWAFHGEDDEVVSVTESQEMIEALEQAGRECIYTHCNHGDCTGMTDDEIQSAIQENAKLLYTEWPDLNHEVWDQSYEYPYLFPWVFTQSKESDISRITASSERAEQQLHLVQNYPNPFNSHTRIVFTAGIPDNFRLVIYNPNGEIVQEPVNHYLEAGTYEIRFNASRLSSGIYICQLSAVSGTCTRKMILIK